MIRAALLKLAYWLSQAITYGLAACMILGCLFGCTKQAVVPVTLPPVCPAPREKPDMPDLIAHLPNLDAAAFAKMTKDEQAAALLANRVASQQLYDTCVSRYSSQREWINGR